MLSLRALTVDTWVYSNSLKPCQLGYMPKGVNVDCYLYLGVFSLTVNHAGAINCSQFRASQRDQKSTRSQVKLVFSK